MFPALFNEKNRQIWVKKQLKLISANKNILDAGAGECQYKKNCEHLKYTSQDFCQYDGKGNNIGLQTKKWDNSKLDIVSDIISIPVRDKSFDNILCTEVLEHISRPDLAIKEFSRILKKEGKLIITAPFCSQTHFAPFHFCTGFNIYWYRKIFKKYGFEIMEYSTNGNYFDFICQELLRIPLVIKKYSRIFYFGYLLYLIIIPLVIILLIVSKLSKKSEQQLCFGYHLLAKNKNL